MKKPMNRGEGRAFHTLKELVLGARPIIYIFTPEEVRAHDLITAAAESLFPEKRAVWTWSSTRGLRMPDDKPSTPECLEAHAVLEFIARYEHPAIFHLMDFHDFLRDYSEIRRTMRDLYQVCLDTGKFIVMTSPIRTVPEELTHQIAYMDLLHPDLDEILSFLDVEIGELEKRGGKVDNRQQVVEILARALQGLSLDEARHALRRSLAMGGELNAGSVPMLLDEKKLVVNKSRLVEFIADGTNIDHVGGLSYLKQWLQERRRLFMDRDKLSAEIVPKGVLVMGVSGCGKSLSVKSVASCFELPLYRIDMIEVFSGRHGSPDAAFVEACRTVEVLAPAVVWFDEIEMGLSGKSDIAATNLGRIFAYFLTWMQEKTRGLFVAATANRIDLLPAEMIRKGRFDEVFFIDLPSESEREEIFRIHLEKRGIDPGELELHRLKRITNGWTGAEIEQCVVSALTSTKLEERELGFEDIHRAASKIIPLSKTMSEQVNYIRSWAYDRAVRASPRQTD